ncbi:tRNA (adenosine(37)-N6)-threonylcarbamoyltransferase complex dimerization subunit type 1 TsaB [Streptococcus sp. CSL10205-OR2]|uniref:tRNA (adenosine(37)-N6)-threonylcarbamoyltransferase complex dimerization subunit type 1 TsaB n=1 Tax=Streptococcus sp. CSL10205-OR2 TaxID=2980558 RepID=UPI0021DB22F6|nr:tRNA (adenosine(37)-N6)-threonylcarbamoyltransferase complex dimerization subunit type 1 TsaB [Streptococcus sp. CSL10205-OR2]MCU9533098.1 tRNA (adenosine(37)-N6)-threonylcarbamoyltransferase complex dimerization subunit type 1 TsaB [Streptococcus sp. CSL10205-OR2]
MKVLAFDTSNKAMSIALLEDDVLLADITLNIKKNHSISLMPSIDFLMSQVGLTPKDLDRIVVAKGPGSYTGLRVAVATAKTLAYTLKIDVVGVSSLAAIALNAKTSSLVVPIIDARRQNVYAGFYRHGQSVKSDQHMSFSDVLASLTDEDDVSIVGEVDAFYETIKENLPKAKILEVLPSAYEIGKLGLTLPPENVDLFVPEYLKRVEAEENWLKTHEPANEDDFIKRV